MGMGPRTNLYYNIGGDPLTQLIFVNEYFFDNFFFLITKIIVYFCDNFFFLITKIIEFF